MLKPLKECEHFSMMLIPLWKLDSPTTYLILIDFESCAIYLLIVITQFDFTSFDKHLKAVEGTGWTTQNGKFY